MCLLKRNNKGKMKMNMCLNQLVLNVKINRILEINEHLDWASNYGLSDDDDDGWLYCNKLKKEKEVLELEINSLKKHIN